MWFFHSPKIVFGEDALEHLDELPGKRAFIVTDANIARLGFVQLVQARLSAAGIESAVFTDVEPDPSLQTTAICASAIAAFEPDWVIGLGGGSCIDVAKAAWLLYECPGVEPAEINPFDTYGLRRKARLMAIPTTSGTGAEATMATVLTDTEHQCKLGLGSHELVPDIAIIDPTFVADLPPDITADTGLDALTHAIEGYTSAYHNDFSDGLCLRAIQLIFTYLPRAYADGSDREARERLHNAATIAGLGFGNSMAALAHAMGHALGAAFHIPHGRAVVLFLPYTIQFTANGATSRYSDIAAVLGLPASDEYKSAANLISAIVQLQRQLKRPNTVAESGISADAFEDALPMLIANAESDTQLVTSVRIPDSAELEKLFRCAFTGQPVDF